MRAALYVRMSTDHQDDSPDVQIARGTAFCEQRGWKLDPGNIYRDDAKSRAEFVKRPGLTRLLADAGQRWDVLVLRDDDRLGGDIYRTGLTLMAIVDAGAQIWYYSTGERARLDDPTSKLMQAVKGYASEIERVKTSERTREHLEHKARQGHVAGGACYGYTNVEVLGADGHRSHVVRKVRDDQAAVVRDVFERFRDGEGVRGIAKALNARGVASPRAGSRGTGSWAPSAIWTMLRRDLYRGHVVWGKQRKGYRGGTKVRTPMAESTWVTTTDESLRIISDDLWEACQARMKITERLQPQRRAPQGRRPRFLLTGLARCAQCGGPIQVASGRASKNNIQKYGCGWHRTRGDSVCGCSLRRPVDAVDHAIVEWIQENVLTEKVVLRALTEVRRLLAERSRVADRHAPVVQAEIGRLDVELRKLGQALLGSATPPQTVLEMISERERQREHLRAELAAMTAAPVAIDLEVRRLEQRARQRLSDLDGMLRRSPQEARAALETILAGPLTFEPIETAHGPRFRIAGSAVAAHLVASPGGFEPPYQG